MSVNLNFDRAAETLRGELPPSARVLVVGVGWAKSKYQEALPGRTIVGLDIDADRSADIDVVADAHDLPFADGEFDAVIAQAVLEHVYDPPRVVAEIHRVLKPDGLVYAETPFMQQVHEGPHDYMRFTLSGHRMIFRDFEERDAGLIAGPGTTMLWSIEYLLLAITNGRGKRRIHKLTRRLLGWVAKLDHPLRNRRHSLDGASATYFLGRRSETRRSVADIEAAYRT